MKREKGVFVIDAYLHDIIAPQTEAEKIPLDSRRQGLAPSALKRTATH
jgi:hypothetical protein